MRNWTSPLKNAHFDKFIIGINASRARSGGTYAHLIGILSELEPSQYCIHEVHVWSYPRLLNALPNYPWLIKHAPIELEKSLFYQLWWEFQKLPLLLSTYNCSIVLNLDAGSLCRYRPAVTMSRDMLSYEPGEMRRFGFSFARLRLIALRYIQNKSLRSADVAVFLTRYAGEMIQRSSGVIENVAYIPHGVSDEFRQQRSNQIDGSNKTFRCLYISNTLPYKHQWHVVEAIGILRKKGQDIELILVGGGGGGSRRRLDAHIAITDPAGDFIQLYEFVPQERLPAFLAQADMFVFASSCENMPNTLVEAMAMGLPIACSNRGPMPEVLEDGGLYFDPENPAEIAEAVLSIKCDAEKRERLATRAKELSLQYSWTRCSHQTFSLLVETARKNCRSIEGISD